MTLMPIVLFLTFIAEKASCERLTITNVTFGEYQGSYEGLDEMGLSIPTIGVLKSATSRQPDMGTHMRRYAHLRLMINYLLGSGTLGARYTSYGCHCLLGPDVDRTATRVPSVDDIDETCRRQTMCMQCAKIDHGSDCQGGAKGYSYRGEVDSKTGERYIHCQNTPGTCRHSLCLCDQALAEGFRRNAEVWQEKNHHEWGNFNTNKKCYAKPAPVYSTSQNSGKVDIISYTQESTADEKTDFLVGETDSFVALEEESETKSGLGGSVKPIVYHAEAASPIFDSSNVFLMVQKEESESEGMQCCGQFPERFPYQSKTGKECCGATTYNSNLLECCNGNILTTIGGC